MMIQQSFLPLNPVLEIFQQKRAFSNAEVPKWLAISEGEEGMKSIEGLIDILTVLSPLPDYQSPSRNTIDVCHFFFITFFYLIVEIESYFFFFFLTLNLSH